RPADRHPADRGASSVDTAEAGGAGPGPAELAADPDAPVEPDPTADPDAPVEPDPTADPDVPVEPDPTARPVTPSIPAPASGAVAAAAPRPSIPPPGEQVPFGPPVPDRTSASASPPQRIGPSRPTDRSRPEGPP
ncbi:hypothetical protein ND748_28055, partial [Frankia sp. AiPs1]|nr:hypothetical protein [Frankia sp. AiPs1]